MAIVDFDKHTADGVAGVHGAGMIGTHSPFLDVNSAVCVTSARADALDVSPVNPDRRRMGSMEGLYVNVLNGAPCRGAPCLTALIRAS